MRRVACQIVATLLAVPAVAQDQSLTLELTEIYRAGGVDAREEWAFFGPGLQASFDGAGNLVVLDALESRIVVIGPDGRLVRAVGRKGEGPGEFQLIMGSRGVARRPHRRARPAPCRDPGVQPGRRT